MKEHLSEIMAHLDALIAEWKAAEFLQAGDLFVIGCSTSEVAGRHIGTSGSEEVAALIYEALIGLRAETGIHLVFQCCEHLNRALVMEKATQEKKGYEVVSVIPKPVAGGSMASYAFKQLNHPVVVETVQAEAGIDIGETLIGMHLKPVAVPVRFNQKVVGEARVIAARTRPKLIGGNRAQYEI